MNLITKGKAILGSLLIGGQMYGGVEIANKTGNPITAGQLVYISGYDATLAAPSVTLADADTTAKVAQLVVPVAIANNAKGMAYEKYEIGSLNTNAASVGDPVYLSATAGGWSLSAPSGADQVVQIIGFVTVKSATVGRILFLLQPRNVTVIGTSGVAADDESHSIFFIKGEMNFGASEIIDVDLGALGFKGTLIGGYCQLTQAQANGDATTVLTLSKTAGGTTPIADTITVTLANTTEGLSNWVGFTKAINPVAGGVDIAATDHIYAYTPDDVATTRSAGKMMFFLLFQKSA